METIYKYNIPFVQGYFEIEMPLSAEILHFDWQIEDSVHTLKIWALVETEERKCKRVFLLVGTGHEIPYGTDLKYIGSVKIKLGVFMYHLFEAPSKLHRRN